MWVPVISLRPTATFTSRCSMSFGSSARIVLQSGRTDPGERHSARCRTQKNPILAAWQSPCTGGTSEGPIMMKRVGSLLLLGAAGVAASVQPAAAQQTLNFNIGYFAVRGEDARVDGDVLNENLNFLAFNIGDFSGATVGGEWLIPIGPFF